MSRTGDWLITGAKEARSRDYNHSTFCDLVIRGIVGMVPRDDDIVEIAPLIPPDTWDWFCLDDVTYHNQKLTIVWDRWGTRFNQRHGTGRVGEWKRGSVPDASEIVASLTGKLPPIRNSMKQLVCPSITGKTAMNAETRRRFLRAAAAHNRRGSVPTSKRSRRQTPSERVRIGVIGCGNQGK